jgi:hypothetical protein
MGPSMIQGAVRPSQRNAAMKVCVPQCPNGARALNRCPRRARPRSRVILVVVAVSSMNASRCGSWRIRGWRWLRQIRRSTTTSSRPASVASSVFFDAEALPDQKPRERRRMGRDAAFGLQLGRQFRHRDIALRLHPASQKGGKGRQLVDGLAARAPTSPSPPSVVQDGRWLPRSPQNVGPPLAAIGPAQSHRKPGPEGLMTTLCP